MMDIQSTSRTVPKTKRWVIGSFTDTNEFSVIPTNWLIRTSSPDGRTIIYCKWPPPPTSVTSDIINIASEPQIDWPSYKIRLANNGKEFTNFKKAWHHKFVLTSDLSANEVDELKNKKLCSQAQNSNFHKDSDSSETEEEVYNILELQGVEKNTHKILSTANSNQQMNISQIPNIQTNRILEVPQTVEDYNLHQYNMTYSLNNSLLETNVSQASDKQMRKKKDLGKVTDRHFKRLLQKEVKTNLINLISTSNFEQSSSQCLQIFNTNDGHVVNDTIFNLLTEPNILIDQNIPIFNNVNDSKNNTLNNNFSNTSNTVETHICDKLRAWNIQFNVTHNCLNSLLNILRTEGLNVPKDGRTLMKTPSKHTIIQMNNGSYVHFGIEQMVYPILHKHKDELNNINNLKFGINVDGLPLSKSSKSQFWPILMCIVNVKIISKYVIPIGIFHGFEKPSSVDEFLSFFLMDALNMLENGINVDNTLYNMEIAHIVCDAPAKAFLLNVKPHNAYHGCNTCIDEGVFNKTMTFLTTNSPMRTNSSFRNETDENYHKGTSPLVKLPINMIDDIPVDNMHCVYVGVTKRLIKFWVKGKKDIRLLDESKNDINKSILNLRSYVPSEFARLPRSIDDIDHWKATELRTFILYYGHIVLKGKLQKRFYQHFLLLFSAIRLLVNPETCILYNEKARILLEKFISDYAILYGSEFITYNVHNLIHLPYFVQKHGPLDSFSAFRYENYLKELKKSMKCAKYPLQEVSNRIIEKYNQINSSTASQIKYPLFQKEKLNKNCSYNVSEIAYERMNIGQTISDESMEHGKMIMETNYLAGCIFTKEVINEMKLKGIDDGHIININSVAGHYRAEPIKALIHNASKHCVTLTTDSIRRMLIKEGSKIKITSLSPGVTIKESSEQELKSHPEITYLETEDIANATLYILGTPQNVQVCELTIRSVGEIMY
ncbi:hypothetical protein AGLY_013321 [Aphis glycines]|uniref:DUF4218 domain-containing protein n=1 Tax=Aphis glycines TaxID=307491 RepID=A0A6G0T6U4_APHGL|nr:hypothetical protein AGLY_013321 [Aphis glycines]